MRLLASLVLASALAYVMTPVAIRAAARFEFYDKPVGYKGHAAPTPYLGGVAVVTGFVATIVAFAGDLSQSLPIVGGALALWVVGTIDDRRTVPPLHRVVLEMALAVMLWGFDLGWALGLGAAVDLTVTIVWVVAVVNAFNLFDNMDGTATSTALVVAGAVAVLGVIESDIWLAATGAALCGACLGFLPRNLCRPHARIFLGDGGSMPVGFIVAALVMTSATAATSRWEALALGLLLIGIPALDICMVTVSRRRRGISVLTGGRDHLTHRVKVRLGTAPAVAAALAAAQALLATIAVLAMLAGPASLVAATALYLVLALAFVKALGPVPTAASEAGPTPP